MTRAQALKLYVKACESHKRADWRLACHALAEHLGAAQPTRPVSLVAFLAKDGLADDGGELQARDAHLWHRDAPFRRKLVREGGRTLEEAAEAAREAGYFPDIPPATMDSPDNMHPATPAHLVAAIDRELSGRPVYALEELDPAYWDAMEPEEGERAYG